MRWLFLVPLLWLVACSAEERGGALEGGQTGSLLPPDCAVPAYADLQTSEGDAAFVAYVPAGALVDVTLLDSEQQPVELTLEPIGGGAQLARSSQALTAGDYVLAYRCTTPMAGFTFQEQLTVVPADPLPTALGTIVPDFDPAEAPICGQSLRFWLELSPEAVSYEQMIQLEVSVDDQQPAIVVPYGTLRSREGRAALFLSHCDAGVKQPCLPNAQTTLRVLATVAGEAIDVEAASLEFDATCRLPADEGMHCALLPPTPASRGVGWLAGWFVLWSCARRLSRRSRND